MLFQAPFATAMLTYIWNIIKMQITDEEMAIFTSTLLLCPHRSGLSDIERIGSMHRALNDALQNSVSTQQHGILVDWYLQQRSLNYETNSEI